MCLVHILDKADGSIAVPRVAIERVKEQYLPETMAVDYTDGLSMEFTRWRFNLRYSNIEPFLRLNMESKGDQSIMEKRTLELLQVTDVI